MVYTSSYVCGELHRCVNCERVPGVNCESVPAVNCERVPGKFFGARRLMTRARSPGGTSQRTQRHSRQQDQVALCRFFPSLPLARSAFSSPAHAGSTFYNPLPLHTLSRCGSLTIMRKVTISRYSLCCWHPAPGRRAREPIPGRRSLRCSAWRTSTGSPPFWILCQAGAGTIRAV